MRTVGPLSAWPLLAWLRPAWLGAALLAAPLPPVAAQEVEEPPDYRLDQYRAPTPETLEGAVAVDDDAAYALWRTGRVLFVDVMPRPPKPANLPEGTIWRPKKRLGIPGGIWLPNTGYGRLAPETLDYLRGHLAKATRGDFSSPVLFYCLAECWMSWNAAKRALELGYESVFWYAEGTDGWDFAGYPLERHEPEAAE